MGRTGRPNLMHYAIGDSAWPALSRMLLEAPPAAGPTGTAGRARPTQEPTKRHRRLCAQPGPLAARGPLKLRVNACTSRHRRPQDP